MGTVTEYSTIILSSFNLLVHLCLYCLLLLFMMSIENFTLTLMYVCIFLLKIVQHAQHFLEKAPVGDKVNVSHDPMTHHADTDLVMTQEPPLDCPILVAIKQR